MTRKRAGFTSPYLPPELIWACGLTPVRLRPGRSLAAADGYLPRNFSIEARALLAAALSGELPVDIAIFLDEDDTSRRLFDVWRAYAPIPCVDLVALPRLDTPLARERYGAALAGLAEQLGAVSGQPLTAAELNRAVALYNEQRALWGELRTCWVMGGLSAGDWYDLRWDALTGEPETGNAGLAAAAKQIQDAGERLCGDGLRQGDREQEVAGPDGAAGETRSPAAAAPRVAVRRDMPVRLLVLGGMEVPRSFLTFLQSSGAQVVAEDSEADERVLAEPIPGPEGLDASGGIPAALHVLAAAYLQKPSGPRPAELARRLETIGRLIDERRVRGAIAVYPKFADAYLTEFIALGELFRQRGIPALLLEDDGESGFSGQQRTRVEAFLEVLA